MAKGGQRPWTGNDGQHHNSAWFDKKVKKNRGKKKATKAQLKRVRRKK